MPDHVIRHPHAAVVSLAEVLARLPGPAGKRSTTVFEHGTLMAKLYAPRGVDPQTPHEQDEIYVVARGRAVFFDGEHRHQVEPGSFIFVAAGRPHRFEDVGDDFATWVCFYGAAGGEHPGGP